MPSFYNTCYWIKQVTRSWNKTTSQTRAWQLTWYLLQEKLKRLIKYLNFKEIKNKTQKQTSQEDDEVLEATGKYFICRVFSLIWAVAMQIYWNKLKGSVYKIQLPQDWFDTPTWPPFYCFGTPICLLSCRVNTLYSISLL